MHSEYYRVSNHRKVRLKRMMSRKSRELMMKRLKREKLENIFLKEVRL